MNFKHFLTTVSALLAIPVASHAYFTQGDAGQEVFSFINTFDSPRNAALEKSAGAGVSTDPTITQLNPAAVILPENKNHIASVHWHGNIIRASAQITLTKDGEKMQGIMMGDGPIDAAFLCLESIIGKHYELDDFEIQSVTEGKEAMGSALVKLRKDGKLYSGKGISTDIIGASIRAYISAVNKITYEEE